MSLTLRYMRIADIPEVIRIDRRAFGMSWSSQTYAYEAGESTYSYMVVLERSEPKPMAGWQRLLRRLNGHGDKTGSSDYVATRQRVVGYGGLWNIADEAHISTIATHPDYRGRSYGEILLAAMIQRSIDLNAGYVVLEVRVSNTIAQNLYKKYDFQITGTKPSYYRDNMEDAYEMRLDLRETARFQDRFAALRQHTGVIDHYSTTSHPRERHR